LTLIVGEQTEGT